MPFWYYFSVPKLPPEVAHQSNLVEIRNYLGAEGSPVDVGSPIAVVENYWAVMTLKANGKGILKKTFFDRGTSVKIGDPSLSSERTENASLTEENWLCWK